MTNLKSFLFVSRNMFVNPQVRDMVGSYIYEKMGRSGLIITIQDFKHEIPLKAFADLIGAPIEVIFILFSYNLLLSTCYVGNS